MYNTASKLFRDRKDRPTWDEAVQEITTKWGLLKLWKTGVYGGGSECLHAELYALIVPNETELIDLAETYDLVSGDCMKMSKLPNRHPDSNLFIWNYWPSTE